MSEKNIITWDMIHLTCHALSRQLQSSFTSVGKDDPLKVYGIPSGGSFVASLIVSKGDPRGLPLVQVDNSDQADVIVDDIFDSGDTVAPYLGLMPIYVLVHKGPDLTPGVISGMVTDSKEEWVSFPWESAQHKGQRLVQRMIQLIGEDSTREGLRDTPRRVVKSWGELYSGYDMKADDFVTTFSSTCDEMIVVKDIDFVSFCEHHILPFTGKAVVGYIPRDGKIIGLSKIPRVVEMFSRRLQVQERLTREIATCLEEILAPEGVGVLLNAHHTCASFRGVKQPNLSMITSCLLGDFRSDEKVKTEFMKLAQVHA